MTTGGKLTLAGIGVSVIGAIPLAATFPRRPSLALLQTEPLALLLFVGILLIIAGSFVYVFEPVVNPSSPLRGNAATVRNVLAMLVVILAISNLASIPYLIVTGGQPAQPTPAATRSGLAAVGLVYVVIASELPIILVVWLRLLVPREISWRSFQINSQDLAVRIGNGILGGLTVFVAAAVVSAIISAAGIKQNQYERFQGVQGAPLWAFVLTLLAGCVLAPFVEEIFFRGYIFRSFLERRGPVWAYLFSAALFAALHANLAAAAPIFVLGLILAAIYHRTGSLVPGMIAHGLNNAAAFVALYFTFKG